MRGRLVALRRRGLASRLGRRRAAAVRVRAPTVSPPINDLAGLVAGVAILARAGEPGGKGRILAHRHGG